MSYGETSTASHRIIIRLPKKAKVITRNSILLTVIFLCCTSAGFAAGDSLHVLSPDAFFSIVRQYHPVVRSAALQVQRSEAGIQAARGAFDPVASGTFNQKTLDGKTYYQYFRPELSIPTWYGLELLAGVEDVRGERVNPEATIGSLSYAGAKLQLNGLWMDARRAVLRQAQALRTQMEAERRLAVNNLLYDAAGAYYNWQREWTTLGIIRSALQNAQERLRFVRIEYEQGMRPAIDTVEALTQLQSIRQQLSASEATYTNASLELGNYLWLDNGTPLRDANEMQPQAAIETELALPPAASVISSALENHPKLRALSSKIDALSIDRQLKAAYLAPKLSVKATALSKGYSAPMDASTPYLQNNSALSAELRLPLFLREARGTYSAARLKLAEADIELDATTLQIENKIRSAINEAYALDAQLRIARAMLNNHTLLYNGERTRFEIGESTLFLLNSRQNKLIETGQKIAELSAKRAKAVAGIYFSAGMLQ
jgi:outer membrane protein TolC